MSYSWKNFDKAKALELTLDTALKVLGTTENVLNTTPIPGAAAVITVILEVVKRQERANKTATLTTEQQERWKKLVSQMTSCESDLKETLPDALSELRNASKELASRLQGFARKLEEATSHKIRPRWMTCTDDEEALQDFLRKCNEAIADYQYAQGDRIEKCVTDIRERLELLERNRLIGTLPRAELAHYNADRRVGTLISCSEGTRTSLLEDIFDWIADPDAGKLYWLKERAGFGKTAVALSVAERAAKERTLAATFFFSYQIPDLSRASFVITTIVHQLSLFFDSARYKQALAAAIEKHPNALRAQLKDQVQPLFLDPLKNAGNTTSNDPIVIVIDGLDECLREDAANLITTFIAALSSVNLPLKVFITSRPETHLIAAFRKLGVTPRAIDDTSNKDVETYLRRELASIPSKPGIEDLPEKWITPDEVQALLVRSGVQQTHSGSDSESTERGLFVYIATVIRFIADPLACDPQGRLRVVLSAAPPSRYRPFQGLDSLYTRVLDVALQGQEDLEQRFHAVVGGLAAVIKADGDMSPNQVPISSTGVEILLDLSQGEMRRTLINLQSVIKSPDSDSTLPSFHHRSFSDFLTSKDRSGSQYYIDLKLHQKHLAFGCLWVIAKSPVKGDVLQAMSKEDYFYHPDLDFPPEFQYASVGITYYCGRVGVDKDLLEAVKKFISDDFGWWIELVPQIAKWDFSVISDALDPQDEQELPVLFRALDSSVSSSNVNTHFHVHTLMRKELRRYISAVTQRQDGESRMAAQIMTASLKKHIYELRERLHRAGDDDWDSVCVAILVFAKDTEAVVDEFQCSIGNQDEVERNRKRTIFLRRQAKALLLEEGATGLNFAADQFERFELEGIILTRGDR